ncbi:MAG: GyrI-like domain-containing protein [Hydrogenophilaceae bacterium]|jgi:DNA gyrase inhibitor GyrI|nr:GyrI-like domain-containing protein [Hydrogenophilaceae bacterium]
MVLFKKQWPAFLLAFVFPLLGVYGWWGGFNSATVTVGESGPYFYAYMEHHGDIAKLPKTQEKVFKLLKKAGIEPGDTFTVLLTDPRTTPKAKQLARTGYRIPLDAKLPGELMSDVLTRRRVLSARVHAATMLAPGKAYQALYDHLHEQALDITLPAVEIYRPSGTPTRVGELTVEIAHP